MSPAHRGTGLHRTELEHMEGKQWLSYSYRTGPKGVSGHSEAISQKHDNLLCSFLPYYRTEGLIVLALSPKLSPTTDGNSAAPLPKGWWYHPFLLPFMKAFHVMSVLIVRDTDSWTQRATNEEFHKAIEKSYKMFTVPLSYCHSEQQWKWKPLSPVWLFMTPRTIQSIEFSRPEYWSGLPCPPPGDLPNPGVEPRSPALRADSLLLSHQGSPKNTCNLKKGK